MCIRVFAVPAEPRKVSPRRLSYVSGLVVTKQNRPVKDALHFAKEPGCGCSLLSDKADWNSATWDLLPEVLEGLAKALEMLHVEAKGFTFQAIWIGDDVETEAHAPIKELLRDVRANRIKNKHVYRVGRAG
jgi:hypothetical protein